MIAPRLSVAMPVLFLLAAAGLVDANFGGGPPQACPMFKCNKGQMPVPKNPLKLESPGCTGFGMNTMMNFGGAEKPTDMALKPCCNARHACYQICGMSRVNCEATFKKCLTNQCAQFPEGGEDRKSCDMSANMHTLTAGMAFGGAQSACTKYNQQQYTACTCVNEDLAPKRRVEVLRKFYRTHAKDKLDGAKALADKKKTTSKFAKLLVKLVAKYPKAIKNVLDPTQKMYEDILKDKDTKPAGDTGTPGSGTDEAHAADEEAEEVVEEVAEAHEEL